MKKVLIAAATEAEIQPFLNALAAEYQSPMPHVYQNEQWQIHILITGVGMMASAFALSNSLAAQKPDYALQAGIAGSFDLNIPLGSLLGVSSETYGDLGAEDNGRFIPIFDLGFLAADSFPFSNKTLSNPQPLFLGERLDLVPALSVNTVSGSEATIAYRKATFACSIESMEGIAFHYACLQYGIPFLQLRAISNYVLPRNRDEWKIGLAIAGLNKYLQAIFLP